MTILRKVRPWPLLAAVAVLGLMAMLAMCSRSSDGVRKRAESMPALMDVAPTIQPVPPQRDAPEVPSQSVAYDSSPPPAKVTPAPPRGADDEAGPIDPVNVTLPRLAFAYKLGFRLQGDRIAAAQDSHRRLCESMGRLRCQLLALERGAADDAQSAARLKVRVATPEAQRFSDRVTAMVASAGGRAVATSVVAEDVSKEMVDAVARIRQREMLVARLTEILRTRSGKVAELVEAERSVAAAQEELDQTKGWLAELRGRVAMSDFEIAYSAVAPQVSAPVARNQLVDALSDSGASFGIALKSLLVLLIYLAPWLVLLVPVALFARHRLRRVGRAVPVESEPG